MKIQLPVIAFLVIIFTYQLPSLQAAQPKPEYKPWQINFFLETTIYETLKPGKEKKDLAKVTHFVEKYNTKVTCLRTNNIHSLRDITNQMLTLIATHCTSLHTIQLSHCDKITTAVLSTLITRQTDLKEIDLTGMSCITGKLINTILESCPLLTSLTLVECTTITDKHLNYICLNLPKLERLILSGSSGWSQAAIQNLRKARPQLNIYTCFYDIITPSCSIS